MRKKTIAIAALAFLVVSSVAAHAQQDLGIKGVGVTLGLVDISAGSTIGFGGILDLGFISKDLRLEANADYWSKSYDGFDLLGTTEYSLKDFAVGGTVKYELGAADAAARWYVGGGLAMHFISNNWGYSDSSIGLDVLGGVRLQQSAGRAIIGELRYRTVESWTQTCVRAGIVFGLGG